RWSLGKFLKANNLALQLINKPQSRGIGRHINIYIAHLFAVAGQRELSKAAGGCLYANNSVNGIGDRPAGVAHIVAHRIIGPRPGADGDRKLRGLAGLWICVIDASGPAARTPPSAPMIFAPVIVTAIVPGGSLGAPAPPALLTAFQFGERAGLRIENPGSADQRIGDAVANRAVG